MCKHWQESRTKPFRVLLYACELSQSGASEVTDSTVLCPSAACHIGTVSGLFPCGALKCKALMY